MNNIVVLVGIFVTIVTVIPVVLQLRSHPRGLYILFFAEMWERFSYYGMRGLLIFYLTQHFIFERADAQAQYGAYTSLVYLLPLIGGFLADRYLGTRKAIAFGALLLVAGHLLMGVEQKPAVETLTYQGQTYEFVSKGRIEQDVQIRVDGETYKFKAAEDGGLEIVGLPPGASLPSVLPEGSFERAVTGVQPFFLAVMYLALSLIIMGVGFLKPNISTIVGQLYGENDPRRDSGFTLYYFGINFGAFWAGILCGYLGQTVGWWAGFGLAGLGMLAGWVVFVLGKPLLEGKGEPPDPALLKQPVAGPLSREHIIYICGLLGVPLIWLLVQRNAAVGTMLTIGSVIVLGYLGWYMATKSTKVERDRMLLALVLIAASVVFWTLFEQAGSSLNQFAADNTQLVLFAEPVQIGPFLLARPDQLAAITVPEGTIFIDATFGAAQAQSFNSGFILIFAPIFAGLWAFLERRRLEPNDPMKFALALVQVGASFLILVWGASFADESFRVPLIFLAAAYLVQTTGELFLSPVGLSAITKLSAPAVVSTMMAVWFLSSSWAQYLGGFVAQMTATESIAGQVLDPKKALETYMSVYQTLGLATIGIGILLGLASFVLARLAHKGAPAQTTAPQATPAE